MSGLTKPSDFQAPVREAGGDNEVPRDKLGRPRIKLVHQPCAGSGKGISEKTGKPIKCQGCSGTGEILRSYTRTTTYIDVLDDKSNLEAWLMRMVLVGIAKDQGLLNDVEALHGEFLDLEQQERNLAGNHSPEADERRIEITAAKKSIKDELNRRAQIAKVKAGAEDKADKGTALHGLSELVDQGLPLPKGIDFGDVIDMDAYRRVTEGFEIIHMEKLVVHDELKVGGTPDRVSKWSGDEKLVTPDGDEVTPDQLLITDLKTGTVEYGALKMAMQLAIYSRSQLYDPETGERTSMGNVRQDWGVIMNVPAGTGEAVLYWADLNMGWRAVEAAGLVRELRGKGKSALSVLAQAS